MSYRVEVSPEAQKEIRALSGYVCAQALQILRELQTDPRPARSKELRGKPDIYRIWLAKIWRIVYTIDEDAMHVWVLRVRRKEDIDYESL